MSGAVMLLMAATVGITYGWSPDGGNGVKYIIQIPPEKVEQVVHSGEISSHIPREIRAHVSEVVIRVGRGSLPRITPSNLSADCPIAAPSSSLIAAADHLPVPIPSMSDPSALRPIGGQVLTPNAMMKPSPQSGGMNLPGFSAAPAPSTASTGPSTQFGQAAREAANQVGNDFRNSAEAGRQQVQQSLQASTERFGEAASAQMQSAADHVRDSTAQLFAPRPSASTPDDPRARLAQGNAGEPERPSTDPYARNAQPRIGNEQFSGTQDAAAPPAFATSRANASPASVTPPSSYDRNASSQTGESRSAPSPTREDDWYDLRNGSRRRPSTDPIETTVDTARPSDAFSGSNFGRLPGGLQTEPPARSSEPTPPNTAPGGRSQYAGATSSDPARRDSNTTADLDYDPNLTPAQAFQLPKNGYSFDAQNHPVDREGYRLDRYGRRIDRQGRLLTAVDSMAGADDDRRDSYGNNPASNAAYPERNDGRPGTGYDTDPYRQASGAVAGNPYPTGGYSGSTSHAGNSPQLVQPPLAPQPPAAQQPPQGAPYGNYSQVPYPPTQPATGLSPTLGAGMPGYNQDIDSRYAGSLGPGGAPRMSQDAPRASSDSSGRGNRFDDLGSALGGETRDLSRSTEQVAAQPIFNALLLLSIVANVYLLFWLKNLRLQFRDMVASNRAANAGSSLAAGV